MQQKDLLKSFKKVHRSPYPYTLTNYYQLKTFKTIGDYFKVKQTPYPLACDTNNFYFSKNTEKFIEELNKKAVPKFYEKNGIEEIIKLDNKHLNEFNTIKKDYADFTKKLENAEKSILIENLLTNAIEKEIETQNFFNLNPNNLLKLLNPSINLATEEKIQAKKEKLTDKEMGKKYGWLIAHDLLFKGEEIAGEKINEMLKQLDTNLLIENKKKNEEFVKNFECSKKIKIFAENVRKLNYLSCSAHKYGLTGRHKSKPLIKKISKEKDITPINFLNTLPWEINNLEKEKIKARENQKHILLMDKNQKIIEFTK